MPIRILLADDHLAFRQSLRQVLERHHDMEVIAEATSGEEAVDLARAYRPDVVLLDVRLIGMTGIQAIPHIRQSSPQTAIMMLSMHLDRHYLKQSFAAGARAYLLKDSSEGALISTIRSLKQD
jgi:DNA-binding NarL/FixJ family response regulator